MADLSFGEFIHNCLDGIIFKVRENGKVIHKTVFLRVGLNTEGLKAVLDMKSLWRRRYFDYGH